MMHGHKNIMFRESHRMTLNVHYHVQQP